MRCAGLALVLLAGWAQAAPALEAGFPRGAERTMQRIAELDSHALPIGPWADGAMLTQRVEGRVEQTAWRVPGAAEAGTLALISPLRAALLADGWQVLFECEALSCGGFDFRYSIDVLPEPDMHVDLGDFRFLSAERTGPGGPEAVSLLVSRSAEAGFVQVVSIGAAPPAAPPPIPESQAAPAAAIVRERADAVLQPSGLATALQANGSAVLEDLVFGSGSAELGRGPFATLATLADFLKQDPARRVVLVGHTDASGGLAGNTALSRARAASVRERLIDEYAVPGTQITAEGVGYLAPRASNQTQEGRARNRRVEVILTSTGAAAPIP